MTAQADPLRNTLDHLALDPRAKDDRKYLVSMLRRLGYSDAEIQEALGMPAAPTTSSRVIEIEYRPPSKKTTGFEVVEDRFEDASGAGVGFSVTKGDAAGVHDAAIEHGWIPLEEHPDFEERDPEWATAEETAWPQEEAVVEEPVAELAEDTWADEVEEAEAVVDSWDHEPHPEDDGGWQPVEEPAPAGGDESLAEEEEPWTEGEWNAEEASWDETAPEQWEEAPEWTEAPAETAETAETWEEAPAVDWDDNGEYQVTEPPAGAWEPTDEWAEPQSDGFVYEGYHLYTRMVELSTGREQRIFFFAKSEPKSGRPCPLPAGYTVEQNERTGLPFLRRDPEAEVVEDFTGEQWNELPAEEEPITFEETVPEGDDAPAAEAAYDHCQALTKAGNPCKNAPLAGAAYCNVHQDA